MRTRKRVYWTIPFLAVVTFVIASRIIHHDPWRSNTIVGWLGADVYYPRNLSLIGDGVMVALSLTADLGITVGCGLIAFAYWVHRDHSLQLNPEALRLIGASFGLMAATHLVNVATMYSGIYLLDLLTRASAAAACCVTAIYTAKALLFRTRR
jgi:hypothetical protein